MVTGGYDGSTFYQSTEFVYPDGSVVPGKDMPLPRRSHCMASLDSTRVIIISGYEYPDPLSGKRSVSTLIYDSKTDSFEPGPELKKARASMACGVFRSGLLQSQLLLVAGGSGGSNKVEYLDFKRSYELGWQEGKNT